MKTGDIVLIPFPFSRKIQKTNRLNNNIYNKIHRTYTPQSKHKNIFGKMQKFWWMLAVLLYICGNIHIL
jgi:hypothetical protein